MNSVLSGGTKTSVYTEIGEKKERKKKRKRMLKANIPSNYSTNVL
jgi:hypothetical protein